MANHELTVGVFLLLNKHRHLVACLHFWVIAELACANDTFRLVADVDHNFFFANGDHGSLDHFLFLDQGEALFVEVLKTLSLVGTVIVLFAFKSVPIEISCGLCKLTWLRRSWLLHHGGFSCHFWFNFGSSFWSWCGFCRFWSLGFLVFQVAFFRLLGGVVHASPGFDASPQGALRSETRLALSRI